MKIGILDERIVKDIAVNILIDRPEVINVFVEGANLDIESIDIDSLAEFLEKEHGLHLIVNGGSYMIASKINEESLAEKAAAAPAKVADAASKGLVSKTEELMAKKDAEVGKPTTEAEKDEQAEERAKKAEEEGKAEEDVINKFRGIKAMSKEMNPDTRDQRVAKSREIRRMIKQDPGFVRFLRSILDQGEDADEESSNIISLPSGDEVEVRAADVDRSDLSPISEEK